ncbi:MBL fold metallo-hydrolase [Chloroflexota bacterium]
MPGEIKTINLSLPFRLGSVNCYLLETGTGNILIDTGCSNKRKDLVKELRSAGCQPGNLKLIVLTHGDFDHSCNAAYLHDRFGAEIAMHPDDSGIVERGNICWNRKKWNILIRIIAPVIFRFGKSQRFTPDHYIEEGCDLTIRGFNARVLHIPGHSKGSIGILTADGDLFCGDLIVNRGKPRLNPLIDDRAAANTSIGRLKELSIRTVYPAHGRPFPPGLLGKNKE